MFCSCSNTSNEWPNSQVCPVCMGHPGTLPVVNQNAVDFAILIGTALGCTINKLSKFDRKQYFYPDLPKGYQISQFDLPICSDGSLKIEVADPTDQKRANAETKVIRIERAHLEEDTGKLTYAAIADENGQDVQKSFVDYNRAGVPLVEIVTAPDMRSGREAAAYGAELRRIVQFLGVCDGDMSQGSMRFDVNLSIRPQGETKLGTKVELKNMNSFSSIQQAVDFEYRRLVDLANNGKEHEIVQETRTWDDQFQRTLSMRKKEGLSDYRYFPEPDLPPLKLTDEHIKSAVKDMALLPAQVREQLLKYDIPNYDVWTLTDGIDIMNYFFSVIKALDGKHVVDAANLMKSNVTRWITEYDLTYSQLTPFFPAEEFAQVVLMVDAGEISGKQAKDLIRLVFMEYQQEKKPVRQIVEEKDMKQITDRAVLEQYVKDALAQKSQLMDKYKPGNKKTASILTGPVMKATNRKANPAILSQVVNKVLLEAYEARQKEEQ